MHGHLSSTQNFDNQNKNVNTTTRHLEIKTSKDYYCGCKIWQNMLANCFTNHGTRRKVAIYDWSLQLVLVPNNINNYNPMNYVEQVAHDISCKQQ
jgi:hypothetical protein